jgi:hypothetical protein
MDTYKTLTPVELLVVVATTAILAVVFMFTSGSMELPGQTGDLGYRNILILHKVET